jgi:hypothetical protein
MYIYIFIYLNVQFVPDRERSVSVTQTGRYGGEKLRFIVGIIWNVLDFKLSPCCSNDELFSGYFPSVWVLKADVSEHYVRSILTGVEEDNSSFETLL